MKTVILTFDDGLENQYSIAAPILRQYGFKATLYVGQWIKGIYPDAPDHCISKDQLIELHEDGFEIANHTMGHPSVHRCTDAQLHEELEGVENLLTELGLPRPVTFAYPGGAFSDAAQQVLRERGYVAARTCEPRPTSPLTDDPMLVPAFGVSVGTGMGMFDKALAAITPEKPVGLLYHGLPSVHHPPCGIEPEDFAVQMETLHREGIRCITMKQYAREYLGCSC
jgi:peptidoglycan/xylan/chitin deacetylase (PgdA/CDA1 family)